MASERFVNAIWVKDQHFVRYVVMVLHGLWAAPVAVEHQMRPWLGDVRPSESVQAVKEMLSAETGVPVNAIAIVEVADA
jgi:hypothetical protein